MTETLVEVKSSTSGTLTEVTTNTASTPLEFPTNKYCTLTADIFNTNGMSTQPTVNTTGRVIEFTTNMLTEPKTNTTCAPTGCNQYTSLTHTAFDQYDWHADKGYNQFS